MYLPQRQERREFRYPLHLPVLIRTPQRIEMRARSENISLSGILLSSDFLIPEGSPVEVSVGVTHLPDPGILLKARGTVLRTQPKISGDFAVAIQLDRAFQLPRSAPSLNAAAKTKKQPSPILRKAKSFVPWGQHFALIWDTET